MITQTRTQKVVNNRGTVQWEDFVNDFKEKEALRRDPGYKHQVYFYNGKIYVPVQREFVKQMIADTYPDLADNQINKMTGWTMKCIPSFSSNDVYKAEKYIAFRNGIYDIRQKTLIPFDKNLFVRNLINRDYNPYAVSDKVETMIDDYSNGNEKQRLYILCMFAHCMMTNRFHDAGFAIKGGPMTGKTTLVGVINDLVGKDNITDCEIKDGAHGKRAYDVLYGKLANVCDEDHDYGSSDIIRRIIVGNTIYFSGVIGAFNPQPYSTIVYVTTKKPEYRKIHLIELKKKFTSEDRLELDDNDMSALINMALTAYHKNGNYLA